MEEYTIEKIWENMDRHCNPWPWRDITFDKKKGKKKDEQDEVRTSDR